MTMVRKPDGLLLFSFRMYTLGATAHDTSNSALRNRQLLRLLRNLHGADFLVGVIRNFALRSRFAHSKMNSVVIDI